MVSLREQSCFVYFTKFLIFYQLINYPWMLLLSWQTSYQRVHIILLKWDTDLSTAKKLIMTSSNGNIFRVTCPFVRGIHRWIPLTKGQWRGALMFSLICGWTNGWANNRDAGDLKRHRAHYDVTAMYPDLLSLVVWLSMAWRTVISNPAACISIN